MPNEAQKRRLVLLVHHMLLLLNFFSALKRNVRGKTIPYDTCSSPNCVVHITIPLPTFLFLQQRLFFKGFLFITHIFTERLWCYRCKRPWFSFQALMAISMIVTQTARCLHPYHHLRSLKDIDHLRHPSHARRLSMLRRVFVSTFQKTR